ncbi:V-type ATP synthase subunit E [Halapricum desulfuricans]|uniref:A-type ATP synthase subunit E n=1 Tax=Halapricum desulfuricans TaxID=2841257 RepID=A0A897NBD6_9EURY|nr:V-type ATP synthase subunit E [Halapricum desulfuricans]QSG09972.1 Archaeal/vacuolar-type H+-ATPase subunit E [Halapricum desulfuricans]
MSLDGVIEDIRDEARTRADEIRSEAEAEAEEIIADARSDAEQIREEREREVENRIEQEREQRLSSAHLEAKQMRLASRREVLERARERVEAMLADLDEETREELTRALLDATVGEFDDDADVAVYGRADDEELLKSILEDYEGYSFAGEYECLGGVVVESADSRIRINNTFDSVLEDVWQDNLQGISDRLFAEQ